MPDQTPPEPGIMGPLDYLFYGSGLMMGQDELLEFLSLFGKNDMFFQEIKYPGYGAEACLLSASSLETKPPPISWA